MDEDERTKAIALIIIFVLIGFMVGLAVSYIPVQKESGKLGNDCNSGFVVSTISISINILLLFGLMWDYINTYLETKSTFMLGLSFFIGVFFIQSLLSLPSLHMFFGYFAYGLGPFEFIPYMFETVALLILSIVGLR